MELNIDYTNNMWYHFFEVIQMKEIINQRKKELNLTNKKLSELSGVKMGTLSKITAGIIRNPTLTTLKKIAKVLDLSLDELKGSETVSTKEPYIKDFEKLSEVGKLKVEEYIKILLHWENSKGSENN